MTDSSGKELIYDWNVQGEASRYPKRVMVTDETLRDGLQSPSITHPSIQDKVYLLYLMRCLEIDAADLGLCGAGERFKKDVTVLAREIVNQKMNIVPQSAARTLESDIEPIADASQNIPLWIKVPPEDFPQARSSLRCLRHGLPLCNAANQRTKTE